MRGSSNTYPVRYRNKPASGYVPNYGRSAKAEDYKTYVLYSVLGLGTAVGLTFLGLRLVKKSREEYKRTNADRNSLDPGEAANLARRLKMAFENDNWAGWGTDEDMIYEIFREIPDRDYYRKVQQEFASMYGTELNRELENELSSEEYNQVQRILNDNERKNAGR